MNKVFRIICIFFIIIFILNTCICVLIGPPVQVFGLNKNYIQQGYYIWKFYETGKYYLDNDDIDLSENHVDFGQAIHSICFIKKDVIYVTVGGENGDCYIINMSNDTITNIDKNNVNPLYFKKDNMLYHFIPLTPEHFLETL